MPYVQEVHGIYRIYNVENGHHYVGQSRRVKKRMSDHFNLLRRGRHPNQHLQKAFAKYGEGSFKAEIEVVCTDADDLDAIELAFLSGEASFEGPAVYNIARHSCAGMKGRRHSEESRAKMSLSKKGHRFTDEQRARLKAARFQSLVSNPDFMAKVEAVVSVYNACGSYAETARTLGSDTSIVRKTYLKWKDFF